jgi:LAO/AO transport system kinase
LAVDIEKLTTGILRRDLRSLARAISLVEDRPPIAAALLQSLFPHTGQALTIGITGSPGAGKSSLVDKLALYYRQTDDQYVGIIAVDPSSPFSGGAILGDRIRMQTLGLDPKAFIRSMATRGSLGGLSRATADAVTILDAGGYQKIIVETVGVGQDEIDIIKTANVTVVVLVPGMGDDIQAIKAGIMEIADIFVINKADREGVLRTEKELEALLALTERHDEWLPPIIKTVATQSSGIPELATAINRYAQFQIEHQAILVQRQQRIAQQRLVEILRETLLRKALQHFSPTQLQDWAESIAQRQRDPYSIVEEICQTLQL